MTNTTTHNLKIMACFADAIFYGDKTFEIRYNGDRGFQKGDLVNFIVIDEHGNRVEGHDIEETPYRITYVLSGLGIEKDYVVFGIRPI